MPIHLPRISADIDWEFSSTWGTSSFVQYPLFIVNHPMWNDDHPTWMCPRDTRDQAALLLSSVTVKERIQRKKDPMGDHALSHAFAGSQGVYLIQQVIQYPIMFSGVYPHWQLFAHVYEEDKDFQVSTEGLSWSTVSWRKRHDSLKRKKSGMECSTRFVSTWAGQSSKSLFRTTERKVGKGMVGRALFVAPSLRIDR